MVSFHSLINPVAKRISVRQWNWTLIQSPVLKKDTSFQRGQLVRDLYNTFDRKRSAQLVHHRPHLRARLVCSPNVHFLCKIAAPFNM